MGFREFVDRDLSQHGLASRTYLSYTVYPRVEVNTRQNHGGRGFK